MFDSDKAFDTRKMTSILRERAEPISKFVHKKLEPIRRYTNFNRDLVSINIRKNTILTNAATNKHPW